MFTVMHNSQTVRFFLSFVRVPHLVLRGRSRPAAWIGWPAWWSAVLHLSTISKSSQPAGQLFSSPAGGRGKDCLAIHFPPSVSQYILMSPAYTHAVNSNPRHKMRAIFLYGVEITDHMLGSPVCSVQYGQQLRVLWATADLLIFKTHFRSAPHARYVQ